MIKKKVALVTGSTSGIGLALARALAREGASVVLNGFGEAKEIESLRANVAREFDVPVVYSGADMSRGDEITRMVREVEEKLGSVDILVNNAGIQHVSPVDDSITGIALPVDGGWTAR